MHTISLVHHDVSAAYTFTNAVLSNGDKGAQHDPRMPYEEIADNTDHMVTSQIAFHAVMLAAVKTIFTDHDPLAKTPSLYYMDAVFGLEWQPTHYVDISGVFERKCELCRLHQSQMVNSLTWSGFGLVKMAQAMGSFRGLQCGVAYAEGFKPALAWPRIHAGNVLP